MFENDIVQNFLIDNDFGGWIAYEKGAENYAVYKPNNIKLADGTNTTFDSNNPDIRFDDGGIVVGENEDDNKFPTKEEAFEMIKNADFFLKNLEGARLRGGVTNEFNRLFVEDNGDTWEDDREDEALDKLVAE